VKYEKRPTVPVDGSATRGWPDVMKVIAEGRSRLVVECYPGVDLAELCRWLGACGEPADLVIETTGLMLKRAALDALLQPYLTDDRVFGRLAPFDIRELFDPEALVRAQTEVEAAAARGRRALVLGPGASLVTNGTLVYADMPRWEIQQRMRRGMSNWTADTAQEDMLRKYKRGYFVDWRVADRHKISVFDSVDYFLDTTLPDDPRLVDGATMRDALAHIARRPFRVVPYFDPGVWGGQWMRDRFSLPPASSNYAWGFDCVPEENSLLLEFGAVTLEIPSINLVLRHPTSVLGGRVFERFGAEFPIRFDFLDTVKGGNLSLQVHPTAEYAREQFGIRYTQDESYYILDATPDANVYLGLKKGISSEMLFEDLESAHSGERVPDIDRLVNQWPAKKHDHFSIPAGTIHCAGQGCVVLEISATPYIFTFKLWDWGRLGLDGRPRPVHLSHGRKVLDGTRDTNWVESEILDVTTSVPTTDGSIAEKTGLHPLEFIETIRHWFTQTVAHDSDDSVHVLNLVEGDRVVVTSPNGQFDDFEVGYAETFIIPAAVGEYSITPVGNAHIYATVRASIRR
jgi:mannose-6-phosphate isomerase class I